MARFDDEIDLADLVAFAKAYAALGWAVQEQLDDMLDDRLDNLNPNAVRDIESKLGRMHDDIGSLVTRAAAY